MLIPPPKRPHAISPLDAFSVEFCGKLFPRHYAIWEGLVAKHDRLLVMSARGHGKTTFFSVLYALYVAARRPGVRISILQLRKTAKWRHLPASGGRMNAQSLSFVSYPGSNGVGSTLPLDSQIAPNRSTIAQGARFWGLSRHWTARLFGIAALLGDLWAVWASGLGFLA